MRVSVYCSDKMAFEDPAIIEQQQIVMPWLAGFHVNDVYRTVCESWPVKPIDAGTKKPFYSNVPVLLGAGGLDDACRPLYNDMIHHYFPNSQRLLFTKRLHGPLLNSFEGDVYIGNFLEKPFERVKGQKDIEAYDGSLMSVAGWRRPLPLEVCDFAERNGWRRWGAHNQGSLPRTSQTSNPDVCASRRPLVFSPSTQHRTQCDMPRDLVFQYRATSLYYNRRHFAVPWGV